MVEPVDVRPGLGIVASLAAERSAIGAFSRHAVVEFALVRVLVAGGASAVFKFEGQDRVAAASGTSLVAVDARNRCVRPGQGEARVAMLGDCKCGAVEIRNCVAGFALVVVRRGRELIVMGVFVAIAARGKFHLV